MFKKGRFIIVVVFFGLMVYPLMATAGSMTRMIPQQRVCVLENGKQINQFNSEMPMPKGQLLMSKGPCLIQSNDMQLMAQDQSIFALTEKSGNKELLVKKGRIDFSLPAGNDLMSINTPRDSVQIKRTITTAETSNNLVKGYVVVNKGKALIGIHQGKIEMVSQNGYSKQISSGQTFTLAQAELEGGTTDAAEETTQGLTTTQYAAGAAVLGTGAFIIGSAIDDESDGDHEVSPSAP